MTRSRLLIGSLVMGVLAAGAVGEGVRAQGPARTDAADAAVNALVAEVRALRADMAAAARSQLRAQVLLGRVQMQEQRLAYLDKQRADTAAALMTLGQMTSAMRMATGLSGQSENACAAMPSAEARRDCEANFAQRRQQLAEQEAREQQLHLQETDLANALQTEQARWSEFNAQLDELERALR